MSRASTSSEIGPEGDKNLAPGESGNFPLLSEEGWTRQQIKGREASFDGADGVVIQFRQFPETNHHPVCAAKDASQLFLDRAASPPRRGGETSSLHVAYKTGASHLL